MSEGRVEILATDAADRVARIFEAVGSPAAEARIVAEDLVEAELMGVGSHGLMRVAEYVVAARAGEVIPGAPTITVTEAPSAAVVDGGRNFGQVVGRRALAIACDKATQTGVASVVVRNTHHLGRLGALAGIAADRGLICIAAATIRPKGHFVVPWGGRDGRLGTNPFAYGVPTELDPVISDFATSVVPEGVVRVALREGRQVAPGAMVDADGRSTTDPAAFYGPPRGGLLPFGGPVGYKGYALSMLAEFLAGSLAGQRADDATRSANGLWLNVTDPAAFGAAGDFERRASEFVDYVRSSPPAEGVDHVLVPGERELTRRDERGGRLLVQEATWESIQATAASVGLSA
jgi:uncharacterized oxidoreductase